METVKRFFSKTMTSIVALTFLGLVFLFYYWVLSALGISWVAVAEAMSLAVMMIIYFGILAEISGSRRPGF